MKCILHIGMHKTGTTAIQSALDGYDDGYSFVANLGFKNHSAPIRAAFSKRKLDRYTLEAIHRTGSVLPVYKREILSKLDAQASRKDRSQIIISGEEISHLRNDEKKYFIKYLQNHCKKVSAIIYVRDPLSYAASAFQQRVNGGMTAIPKDIDPHYRFRIETFQNQLGKQNVNVREYQKNKLHKSDVVLDFCNQLNLDPTLCKPQSHNASLSVDALRFLFLFNSSNPLFRKDPILNTAYTRLKTMLNRELRFSGPIEKEAFRGVSNFSDCSWLKENSGIDFLGKDMDAESLSAGPDLHSWLMQISDESVGQIRNFLGKHGALINDSYTAKDLINRAYYLMLEKRSSRHLATLENIYYSGRHRFKKIFRF